MTQAIRTVRVAYRSGAVDDACPDRAPMLPDAPRALELVPANRRAHRRLSSRDLKWLQAPRVKYGREVQLVDLSTGGIAVDTLHQLTPESTIVFELTGPSGALLVPARVLRSEMVICDGISRYRNACAFRRPIELSRLNSAIDVNAESSPEPAARVAESTPQASAVPVTTATWQKVVARYRDGTVLRGFTCDFSTERPQLHLSTDPCSGESLIVPLQQLKALFFVRDFDGDPAYVEQKTFPVSSAGRRLEVTFDDGEVLVGTTLAYRPHGHGFFVNPADQKANNIRVFVSSNSVRQIRFLTRV